jgi:pimeloyl-ACP methyl ester carboxylesterase
MFRSTRNSRPSSAIGSRQTLIVWGQNDKIFPADGARLYLRDLPNAELHLLGTGHFALEDKLDVMTPLVHDFLDRNVGQH